MRQAEISLDILVQYLFTILKINTEKAIHYYTLANTPVGPEEFKRAVRISTGQVLSDNLVMTVYAIFDKDGDQKLSQKEFIGVMTDRYARQQKNELLEQLVAWSTRSLKNRGTSTKEKWTKCVKQKLSSDD